MNTPTPDPAAALGGGGAPADLLERTFRAIADPTRRRIVDLLAEGEKAVRDLLAVFSMTQPAISQHLKVLRECGLVGVRQEGRLRVYRLLPEPLRAVHDWAAHYEQFWNARLDALGDHLDRVAEEEDSP